MARRRTLIDLLDELAPQVRDAFVQSVGRMTSSVQIAALEDAIRRNDTAAVIQILSIDSGYFAPLDKALRDAHEAGGEFVMQELQRMARRQGVQVSGFFAGNDPDVTRWLERQSSRRIVEITEDRAQVIRDTLAAAAERGTAPRTAALDLVGRMDRVAGRRAGGVIGLTARQAGWAEAAYRELVEGDPAYFRRSETMRDRRFDRRIARYIREGRGVPPAEARKIVSRYRDGILRYRGENIARTELLGSLHHSQDAALDQMRRREGLDRDAITLTWDATLDGATRLSHFALDGQKVTKGEAFVSPVTGARMKHPGDASLGAPASELVNCRCRTVVKVDFISGLRNRLTDDERRAVLESMG